MRLTDRPSFRTVRHVPAGKPTKRWWGYFIWIGAALMVAVPEITAAVSHGALGFITISETIGHLERYHDWVELGVIASIVLVVFSLLRIHPRQAGVQAAAQGATRTAGGRLTFHPTTAGAKPPSTFDGETAPWIFAGCAFAAMALVGFGGWAATEWWDDPRRFHASFVIYVPLAVLWFVVPSAIAAFWGADVPFPTMFRTVHDLEDRLARQNWGWALGPKLAWLVTYMIFAGLAILLIHLTLYPFPSITHVIDPGG